MKDVFKLSDATYNKLKWVAQILIPALITFYGLVGITCNIPATDIVVTIAGGFDALLGAILGVSTKYYNESEEN